MTTDEIPPGHVGNLTEEQEIKLQELWAMTLKVFGVKPEGREDQASMRSAESTSESPSPEKKKGGKKRLGLFSRKDDEPGKANELNTENGISASLAGVKISDSDDKYGQLKDFQQAIADESPEDLRVTFWNMVKHDNPDALLLRFLRARKWDVHKALVMMISTMRWRLSEMHVDDDIMKNGEALALEQSQSSDPAAKKAGEEFLHQIRMGKSFLHGVDKNGRPMCLVRVRLHRAADQSPETLERYTVYTIETARMMLAPPIETATIIFDMTDFSLANMDYTPVKFMIKCFEANYPESLGAVLIHKAPWIFSGIWNIIKGWLDPVVAAKIHFTKSVDDLEKFIPRGRIMKELGGDEDFEYKYIEPQLDENAKMEDTARRDELVAKRQALCKEFQTATFAWIAATSKGDTEAVAVEKAKRADLTEKIRKGYWELDPYVRARSYYDRTGVIMGGGKIKFYPDLEVKVNGADS
ncbi:hypothetical protein VTN00DRAFT_5577 [Thermoascus crustaceus]|uniref:uncharacterized protein n=1 Tax=Thermoascus crustaceus TaxID=5088 RepID=UPI00374487E2